MVKFVSEETREKLQQSHIGKKLSLEHRAKIGKSHIGMRPSVATREQMSLDRKGKPKNFSNTVKEKLARLSKERWANPEYRVRFITAFKSKRLSQESKHRCSIVKLGHGCSKATKHKIGDKSRERWANLEYRERAIKAMTGWHQTEEWKANQSKIAKECWLDPLYAHKVLSGVCKHPNKKESLLMDMINEVAPNQYRFTGDGSFAIYNLHPDFTNCNGQKKVIEHYGRGWHRGENPQNRIDKFAEFGFDCLIVWEQELSNRAKVILRIKEFNEKK